jgi:signal transduction histidine kinase
LLFRLFPAVCAGAFFTNLASALLFVDNPAFAFLQSVMAGLLPAMMLHLVLYHGPEEVSRPGRAFWRVSLVLVYSAAVVCACARQLSESDRFDNSAALVLASATLLGISFIVRGHRADTWVDRRRRTWTLMIFAALFLCALASLRSDNPILTIAPDYLLLAFFTVQLYYTGRLAFFDMFLRGGAYFSTGFFLLTATLPFILRPEEVPGADLTQVWIGAVLLMPIWLIAPFLYRRLSTWIDRAALKRRYSRLEAEKLFTQDLQTASTEAQLNEQAVRSLETIFGCRAVVRFDGEAENPEVGSLVAAIAPAGFVLLRGRENGTPFLSDEQGLLRVLTATLGIFLQNLRFQNLRRDQLVKEQELRALTSRAELRALRAQINPHFLFNALNAVASCIRTRPEVADDTLTQLAGIFRYTLRRSQNEWVLLADEIEFIRSYLAVEHARFGDRLLTSIEGAGAAAAVRIPAMMIQPLVENAIIHGTSQVTGEGRIAIVIANTGETIRISVTDNGPGFPAAFQLDGCPAGHGLKNVAGRLNGYYGGAGSLRWQNEAVGSVVTIEFSREVDPRCAS